MDKAAQLAVIPGVASALLIGIFWKEIRKAVCDLANGVPSDFGRNRG